MTNVVGKGNRNSSYAGDCRQGGQNQHRAARQNYSSIPSLRGKSVTVLASAGGAGSFDKIQPKTLENAFWKKTPINGRIVQSEDVLRCYRSCKTSLNSGRFVKTLWEKGLCLESKQVSAQMVIDEYLWNTGRNDNCKLSAAIFQGDCVLSGVPLYNSNGDPVTAQDVLDSFPTSSKDDPGRIRFMVGCIKQDQELKDTDGRLVTRQDVFEAYKAIGAQLLLARFMADCFVQRKPLLEGGEQITGGDVLDRFPDTEHGVLGKARFRANCFKNGLTLKKRDGTLIMNTETVVRASFPDTQEGKLGKVHFEGWCFDQGLSMKDTSGTLITGEDVLNAYQNNEAWLASARFMQECFEAGRPLNGRDGHPITGKVVLDSFPKNREGKLGKAYFMKSCFVNNRPLTGRDVELVAGEEVRKAFEEIGAERELAIFLGKCFLMGRSINFRDGHPVTGNDVLDSFPRNWKGRLDRASFMMECFEKHLPLKGRGGELITITGEDVLGAYKEVNAQLKIVHLMELCFTRGLPLRLPEKDGKPVELTGESVLEAYQEVRAVLDATRFMEICFLAGLPLQLPDRKEKPVRLTGEVILDDFRAISAEQESAHFMVVCFENGIPLKGRDGHPITGQYILDSCPATRQGRLLRTRFMEVCFLKRLSLKDRDGNSITITASDVLGAFEEINAELAILCFKRECCLRSIRLQNEDGQKVPVRPEDLIQAYKQGGWMEETAFFMSRLALSGIPLDGLYLSDQKILDAFASLPGDQSNRKAEYLIRRLIAFPRMDETGRYLSLFQQAWQLLLEHPRLNEYSRCQQWMLRFIAMRQGLTVGGLGSTPDQVNEHLDGLRTSFKKTRLKFYFLVELYFSDRQLNGLPVSKTDVFTCLKELPEDSRARVVLSRWFDQHCRRQSQPEVVRRLIDSVHGGWFGSKPAQRKGSCPVAENPVYWGGQYEAAQSGGWLPADHVVKDNATYALKLLSSSEPAEAEQPGGLIISDLIKTTLRIIGEVNANDSCPSVLVTGSFSRYLQGRCTSFNDIDLIVDVQVVNSLSQQLQSQLGSVDDSGIGEDYSIPVQINTSFMPGCGEIGLPAVISTVLGEGDLNQNRIALQANLYDDLRRFAAGTLAISVPGLEQPVTCLSFDAEIQLMIQALTHLTGKLETLTRNIQCEGCWYVPRTLIFQQQQTAEQRIHALLMRCLLTLNKAEQLAAIPEPGTTGVDAQGTASMLSIRQSIHGLQEKLRTHSHCDSFRQALRDWLSREESEIADDKRNKYEFVRKLKDRMDEIAASDISDINEGIKAKVVTHVQRMINTVNEAAEDWAVILVSGSYAHTWQIYHRSIAPEEIELTATLEGITTLKQLLKKSVDDSVDDNSIPFIPLSVISVSEAIPGYEPLFVPDQECIEIRTTGNRHLLTIRANIWPEIPVNSLECCRVHPADLSEVCCDLVSFYGEAVLWLTAAQAYLDYMALLQSNQNQCLDNMPEFLVRKWPFAFGQKVFALLIQGVYTLMRGEALRKVIKDCYGYTNVGLSEDSILQSQKDENFSHTDREEGYFTLQSEILDRIEIMKVCIGKSVVLHSLIDALDCWLQNPSQTGYTEHYHAAKSLKDKVLTLRAGYG